MEQQASRETGNRLAIQDIYRLLWNPKYNMVLTRTGDVTNLRQLSPVNIDAVFLQNMFLSTFLLKNKECSLVPSVPVYHLR
jgi:hypothetical protein